MFKSCLGFWVLGFSVVFKNCLDFLGFRVQFGV